MAVGDAAGQKGLATYGDNLLVKDVDLALNQRGDDIAATMTRLDTVEKAVVGTPMFSVTRGASAYNVGPSTWIQVASPAWGTPVINRGFTWNDSGELTVTRAGIYAVNAAVHMYNDDYVTVGVQVTRNTKSWDTSGTVAKGEWTQSNTQDGSAIAPLASATRLFVPLNVGDVLRMGILQINLNNQTLPLRTGAYDMYFDVEFKADQ